MTGMRRIGETVASARERVEARGSGAEKPVPVPWPTVADALGGGLWPGLHVLAGEGDRSSWAVEAVVHAASDGVPVLYLSPELDSLGLHCRALSTLARLRCSADVAWSDAYVGRNRFPDGVAEALEAMPIYFPELDAVGFTGAAILGAVNAFRELHPRAEHPRALVVVDSLQMVASPDGVREEARERVGRAAATCLTAARRHEAAVLALSSVSRRGADDAREALREWRRGGSPRLADLASVAKESGDVECLADSVLVLCGHGDEQRLMAPKVLAGVPAWCDARLHGDPPARPVITEVPWPPRRGRGSRQKQGGTLTMDGKHARRPPDFDDGGTQ